MSNFINKNYKKQQKNYVFCEINAKISEFLKIHPSADIISLGIGDTTRAFSKDLIFVMQNALNENSSEKTFHGYPPEDGYTFLKKTIQNYYKNFDVKLSENEIFVSNGIGCDITNILDIFDNFTPLIITPCYPAYMMSNLLLGKTPKILTATAKNNFCVLPNNLEEKQFIIYLCSPNNPTGYTYTKKELKQWVDFANKTNSVILFDSAYEFFIEDNCPHSIFEIEGAKTCAIEFASLSKTAGFTNLRCGYTIIAKELFRDNTSVNKCFYKRQTVKFNGVPYHIQKGAEYALSENAKNELMQNILFYKNNVNIISNTLKKLDFEYYFSKNSPYLWLKCPKNQKSWQFFDILLENCNVVCVPGIAFGKCGEGFVRLSGFGQKEKTILACERIFNYFKKEKYTTS